MNTTWSLTDDLPVAVLYLALTAGLAAVLLLAVELRSRERLGPYIFLSGVLAVAALLLAVLRPVQVDSRGSVIGPRVVVLVDQSRRLLLPSEHGTTRREVAGQVVERLSSQFSDARLTVLGFGSGPLRPLEPGKPSAAATTVESDLVSALASLSDEPGERPQAVVVVTDGRLTRPGRQADDQALGRAVGPLGQPVHSVRVADSAPRDASIRAVRAAGAAVAHQPLVLDIEVGCAGGLACKSVPVTVRELREGVESALLASGVAQVEEGRATIRLKVTLERAGDRIVEVAITPPTGDEIPENDTRVLSFRVARERIRLLHVAGRPTYDVRALRTWLKNDESVDVIAFFILRTDSDEPGNSRDNELSLIPFPVDELFTQHLPSFDAVVLQDINADKYRLARYLPNLAEYVEQGGGLIMVGGPTAFVGGGYADTALGRVLPVKLSGGARPFETPGFVPRATPAGRAAPVLGGLRELLGDQLPEMPGSNTVGAVRPGGLVLWEHPSREAGGQPMPVLALGEAGDGRSIALGVDGTHRLSFGRLAAKVAGRAYGALWDGLLGWLMRDPRYESARLEVVGECIAGEATTLRLHRLPGTSGAARLTLERLNSTGSKPKEHKVEKPASDGPIDIPVGKLAAGGYSAKVRVGDAPPTRQDFACEAGGAAWTDSRPDPELLRRIASVTGGVSVSVSALGELPLPDSISVSAERHVSPALPAWVWSLIAAVLLGGHWLVRRRGGLA